MFFINNHILDHRAPGIFCLVELAVVLQFSIVICPPVKEKTESHGSAIPDNASNDFDNITLSLSYERYLQEVVNVLESDPAFKEKLEKANPDDIKSGKIAEELDFLHHNIRSKLNEVKRLEIERLREMIRKQIEIDNGAHNIKLPNHLDHGNLETFEKDDLKKLILQTTKDLEELDKRRQEDFKKYEMEKEIKWREELAKMPDAERAKAVQEHEKQDQKHKDHEKLKHPGSKDQLQEVWNEVDNLPKEAFDMRTFFNLHDLTGDGFLDQEELEALFQKELDKVYGTNQTEDDMREREEEQARMREHVIKEIDLNKDGLVSLEEFLREEKDADFNKDPGWQTLDEQQPVYSEADLKTYEEQLRRKSGIPHPDAQPHGGVPVAFDHSKPDLSHPKLPSQGDHHQAPSQQLPNMGNVQPSLHAPDVQDNSIHQKPGSQHPL